MSEQLLLNGYEVDIYKNDITRKIRIGEIGEVMDIKSSKSYTFKLPHTANNIAFFDMLTTIGNNSKKPYEVLSADYIVDGNYLVRNGFAIVRRFSGDFEINLIDGIKSLSTLLNGSYLNELPLDDLNHMLRTDVFVDSYSNTSGFIYAMAYFGYGYSVNTFDLEYQAPSIYIHTLFKRIFEANGLTLQGDFFESNTDYLAELMPPTVGNTITESSFNTPSFTADASSDLLVGSKTSGELIKESKAFTLTDNSLSTFTISNGNLVAITTNIHTLTLQIDYSITGADNKIEIYVNDEIRGFINLDEGETISIEKMLFLDLTAGDVVKFNFVSFSSIEGFLKEVDYSISFELSDYVGTGTFVKPANFIGEITQAEFVAEIAKKYGLIIQPIAGNENYRIIQLETLLNDFDNSEDWTNKLIKISSENYNINLSQRNIGKYQNSTLQNQGVITINNDNIAYENAGFIESNFYTPDTHFPNIDGSPIREVILWEDNGASIDNLTTDLYASRIGRKDFSYALTVPAFGGDATPQNVQYDVPFIIVSAEVLFQYLFDNYYSAFKRMFDTYKEHDVEILLNPYEVRNLDFFKLKYLKQTQRFYYLDSVTYKAGEKAKAVLIEINKPS